MPELICPFRATTGLPCPLCGSTRGVLLALQGDPGFVEYNAVVVVLVALIGAYVVARLLGRGAAVRERLPRGRTRAGLIVFVGALAWAWALAHRDTIVT